MYARCCAARGASNERAIGTYEPAGPSIGVTTRIATRTAAIAASERHDRTRPSAIGVRSNSARSPWPSTLKPKTALANAAAGTTAIHAELYTAKRPPGRIAPHSAIEQVNFDPTPCT